MFNIDGLARCNGDKGHGKLSFLVIRFPDHRGVGECRITSLDRSAPTPALASPHIHGTAILPELKGRGHSTNLMEIV